MSKRLRAAAALLALALPCAAPAQAPTIQRPRLVGADTNSAQSYYQFGMDRFTSKPSEAADAFYWAARLAPGWADANYARALALMMADRGRLLRYYSGDDKVYESDRGKLIDSLRYEAYRINPFLVSKLDYLMVDQLIAQLTDNRFGAGNAQRSGDFGFDGWMEFQKGNYPLSIKLLSLAIKRDRKALGYHELRGRGFFAVGLLDSARAEIEIVMTRMRELKKDKLERSFETAAMFRYMLGYIQWQKGDGAGAREQFQHALEEDLSFYRAHAALAEVASQMGDTATAIAEYGMAVDLAPTDAQLQYGYALELIRAHRAGDALPHLLKATELAPEFAHPYFLMGRLHDASGYAEEAKAEYAQYIARAPQGKELEWTRARLAEMGAATASAAAPDSTPPR